MPRTPNHHQNQNNNNRSSSSPVSQIPFQPTHHESIAIASSSSSATSHFGDNVRGGTNYKEEVSATKKQKMKQGFDILPNELVIAIFCYLNPEALHLVQLVCKRFRAVVADDASWRDAFETYYGVLQGGKVSLGRRLDVTSWKNEYIGRNWLNSRWAKSRVPSITHDPHLNVISHISVNLPSSTPLGRRSRPSSPSPTTIAPSNLLSISLPSGRVVLSDPFTGKTRKPLSASPVDNFGFALHPNLPLLTTTAFAVSSDGAKVIWGMQDGSLRILDTSIPTGLARAWAVTMDDRGDRVRPLVGHGAAVSSLCYPSNGDVECWASVGEDGRVAVWSFKPYKAPSTTTTTPIHPRTLPVARKIWDSSFPQISVFSRSGEDPTKACVVALDTSVATGSTRKANVVVGLTDGAILVWIGVELDLESATWQNDRLATPQPHQVIAGGNGKVDTLVLDPTSDHLSLLVHHAGLPSFTKHTFVLSGLQPPTSVTFGHKPDHLGPLSAFATDFKTPPVTPSIALNSRQPRGAARIVGFQPYASVSTPSTKTSITHMVESNSTASICTTASDTTLEDGLEASAILLNGMNRFGTTKYVVAGDEQGRVFVWDWDVDVDEEKKATVEPARMIQGFEAKVTAVAITDNSVFVGGLDGAVRCYDILTSTLLRTLKDRAAARLPARMLNAGLLQDDEARWRVGMVRANRESVVVAVGGKVLAWRIVDEPPKRKTKASGKMSARTERGRSDFELRREVRESLSTLSAESDMRVSRLRQDRRLAEEYGLPPSLENMTEEEAVALAMMLSVDDQEARLFGGSGRSSARASPAFGPVPEDEPFELDSLSLDDHSAPSPRGFGTSSRRLSTTTDSDSDDESETHSTPSISGSYTRSLSIPSSSYVRGGSLGSGPPSPSPRSWTPPTWRPASASPSSVDNGARVSGKVVVSPRLGPTYGGSRVPEEPVPDMRPDLWPTTSSPSPQGRVTTPATPPVARRGWNDVARSAPSPASDTSSPSPVPPSPASLLTTQLRGSSFPSMLGATESPRRYGGPRSREEELRLQEEEELRFALELSLAEEASRLS